jgi:hypothetical protein
MRKGDLVAVRGNSNVRVGVVLEVMDAFAIVFWNRQRSYEIENVKWLKVISEYSA